MIVVGDCREVMAGMEPESVDAIVTDPPYGLEFMGKEWDSFPLRQRTATDSRRRKTGEGAATDAVGFARGVERLGGGSGAQEWHLAWAREAYRVLKPGGHLLAFGGSRTYHRMACAVEDAGFEIRDQIQYLYGSGFPKSLNVGKAFDRRRNDDPDRQSVGAWLREQRESRGFLQKQVAAHWPSVTGGLTGCVANWEGGFNCPTWEQWLDLKRIIGFGDEMDAEVWRLNGRKGTPGEAWDEREIIEERTMVQGGGNSLCIRLGERRDVEANITAPATDLARQWDGWGTALKPAHEPIVVARKPLIGTVAANVERYGTGALNIDGCRVEIGSGDGGNFRSENGQSNGAMFGGENRKRHISESHPSGRWPANVVLDEEAGAVLDSEAGNGNGSGPSRFFYCAKASRKERERGLEGLGERDYQVAVIQSSGRESHGQSLDGKQKSRARNHHPCIKPIALMRWLVRLITPPGGLVLDPFAGSGTTGIACALEGFEFVGIEQDAEYAEIAEKRIAAVEPTLFAEVAE